MISPGSPMILTVFCLDVCPAETSHLHPVMSEKYLQTSLLALPSSGGADTLTFRRRLHSSYPSAPGRLDLGETDTSMSTCPPPALQTSETFTDAGRARSDMNIPRDATLIYPADDGRGMAPAAGPMSFDELGEIYRMEKESRSLTQVRRDLYRAMADLQASLREEYGRQAAADPDSVMAEGANQQRKRSEWLCKEILSFRMMKISSMAVLGAQGAHVQPDRLTDEEKAYYDELLALDKRQFSEVDRLRGRRTVDTRIDEPPEHGAEPSPAAEPVSEPERPPEPAADVLEEPFDEEPFNEEFDIQFADADPGAATEPPAQEPAAADAPEPDDDLTPVLIRILEDLPDFAGPDRDYSLAKEDLVTLPKVLADILVNGRKAVRVAPTP